jgi:replicative DNA helicase
MSDQDIIGKARGSKIGFDFEDLYNGDISKHGNDDSRADLALCSYIAFYTQDPAQIDRIFRSSGLYRDKWEREDYRRRTIETAIRGKSEIYSGGTPQPPPPPSQPSTSNTPNPPVEDQPPNTQPTQDGPEAREVYLQSSAAHFMQGFINGIQDSVNTPYIPTGFDKLDNVLDGGFYEGLYIMGAITSLGKTSLALQIADQVAQAGQDVLIFSLEMARAELMAKSISRLTIINCPRGKEKSQPKTTRGITTGKRWERYSQEEKHLITSSMNHYSEYARRIYISEGMGDIGADQIREKINQHILFTGSLPFVVVDYLQLLAPHDPRSTDKQNTDKNVLELKRISRDYKIPVLAISSFNRQNYNSPVTMEAFKESGAIEYSSDVLIGLQAAGAGSKGFDIDAEKKKDPRHVELKILKNRNGRTGDKLYYDYYPKFNYFTETEGGLEWDSKI